MSDSLPHPVAPAPALPANPLPPLEPVAALAALGSPFRWPIIQLLADGRELSITDGAAVAGCTAVNFSKHLGVLAAAGVVECYAGADRRKTMFRIPAACRQTPGVIDYGFCKLTVNAG